MSPASKPPTVEIKKAPEGELIKFPGTKSIKDIDLNINTDPETVMDHVRCNISRHHPQVGIHTENPNPEVAIVGGGWSLDETLDELLELCWRGVPILALNGAGNYLMKLRIRPGGLVILDAKEVNYSFVAEPIPGANYFLGSQVHPGVFDACEDRKTYIFHANSYPEKEEPLLQKYYRSRYAYVPGGSTVGLRAISLAHRLGFRLMHLFGMDSCYAPDGRHHSYSQEWNDGEGCANSIAELTMKGETEALLKFPCSLWQASQAEQFARFIKVNGKFFKLSIYGDGLLAAILETCAELQIRKTIDKSTEVKE